MAYLRFLNDKDYISVATAEHMEQLIRDHHDRLPEAEARAETKFYEHLDQYYDIDRLFAVGKNIREYDPAITYPANIWILKDGEIFKTLRGVNGIKRPTTTVYWRHITEIISPMITDHAERYSQLGTYPKGKVVRFGTEYYQCVTPNGYSMGNVRLPGPSAWEQAEVTPWEPNMEWEPNQVCSYEGYFYQYLGSEEEEGTEGETPNEEGETQQQEEENQQEEGGEEEEQNPSSDPNNEPQTFNLEPSEGEEEEEEENTAPSANEPSGEPGEPSGEPEEGEEEEEEEQDPSDKVLTPEEDERWGLIGDYTDEYEYTWDKEGEFDYVVADNAVFYPVMNPNAEALVENDNIVRDDPRHAGVKQHMLNLAVYYLHMIISPTNISETRRWAYEESIAWLYNASKFKINPHIPRKREKDSHLPKVDWALETFQRDYDPNQNPWLI